MNTSIDHSERAATGRALQLLSVFRDLDPEMPIGAAHAFLHIAAEKGLCGKELARKCQIAESSASRYVQYLSKQDRHGRPGKELVKKRWDRRDTRRLSLSLTDEGTRLMSVLVAIQGHQQG